MKVDTIKLDYKLGETIKIRPISDVHLQNKWCDKKAFKRYLDVDDSTYFLSVGDLFDGIITSDLKRYRKSTDDTESDDILNESVELAYDLLNPVKEKILFLADGNHEKSIQRHCSFNMTRALCTMLDVPQFGYSWMFRLILALPDNGGRGRSVYFYGHHGWGGGTRTEGGNITKFSKHVPSYDADIYLFGHVHECDFKPLARLSMCGNRLISKPKHLAICGTFLKTLTNTIESTYSEEHGFRPVAIGGLEIEITPITDWCDIRMHLVS